ncbi:MAG TPA: hypothetical protein VK553_07735 [Candidatus Nitrosopolaris rasttigaisensis]|jgi:hypothetical protein|nr:hypothetical protein [Candidatus Nitrosopolaris rasttigaisensis]
MQVSILFLESEKKHNSLFTTFSSPDTTSLRSEPLPPRLPILLAVGPRLLQIATALKAQQ